jgi:hypothetical protein
MPDQFPALKAGLFSAVPSEPKCPMQRYSKIKMRPNDASSESEFHTRVVTAFFAGEMTTA